MLGSIVLNSLVKVCCDTRSENHEKIHTISQQYRVVARFSWIYIGGCFNLKRIIKLIHKYNFNRKAVAYATSREVRELGSEKIHILS